MKKVMSYSIRVYKSVNMTVYLPVLYKKKKITFCTHIKSKHYFWTNRYLTKCVSFVVGSSK